VTLSPETQARLAKARINQSSYVPSAEVGDYLSDKALVMVIGPAAIGKSFVMNHLVESDKDFARVPVFTTRDARPDDEPGMFEVHPHDDNSVNAILDKIEARQVVQYAIHPTTGRIYGSTTSHYTRPFNLLATLSTVVGPMRHLPFKNTFAIALSTDSEAWKTWFFERYPEASEERTKRLAEATECLEWALSPDQEQIVRWVYNDPKNPAIATTNIINIVKYNNQGDQTAAKNARLMLELAKHNLQEENHD
jgi:hypothetical protein